MSGAADDRSGSGESPTRWLSDEELQTWRTFFNASKRLVDALDRQLQRDADMPLAYYEILVRLADAPNRAMRMSELARATTWSPSRLTHAVNRIEERGWVARTSAPEDGRGQVARLADRGFEVLSAVAPLHVAAVRTFVIDRLSSEQLRQLTEISRSLLDGFGDAAR